MYVPQRPFRPKGQVENTTPSMVLGVFGLAPETSEADLRKMFEEFGTVERINVIYDKQTAISRGFGFIYMGDQEGATKAKESLNGAEIHGRQVRVDYSLTSKPHDSTPGMYMGQKRDAPRGPPGGGGGRGGYGGGFGGGRGGRDGPAGPAAAAGEREERRRSRSPPRGRDLDD